ncbi:MAG: hypothetical protein ACQEP8_02640 [Chlamydiota bacterium]
MVRKSCYSLLLLILCWGTSPLLAVNIKAHLISDNPSAHHPLRGEIEITIEPGQVIDSDSFTIGKSPLKVELMNSQEYPSSSGAPNIITIYSFELPSQSPGQHLLAPIGVRVDGRHYTSQPEVYRVHPTKKDPRFLLETSLEGPSSLFPGQHTTVTYQIKTKAKIDITDEYFPLLKAKGFKKIGSLKRRRYRSADGYDIQELSQKVEAHKPGIYKYESSFIEGYIYEFDMYEEVYHFKPKLRADYPPLTVIIEKFPPKGKPNNFYGTIGDHYDLQFTMLNPQQITFGDPIKLELIAKGDAPLETISIDSLIKQPAFKEHFKLLSQPQSDITSPNTRRFVIELYPLSVDVDSIPSWEFSYFSPSSHKYITHRFPATPITILSDDQESSVNFSSSYSLEDTPKIAGNVTIHEEDLKKPWPLKKLIVWTILIGILLVLIQIYLKYRLTNTSTPKPSKSSKNYFDMARQSPDNWAFLLEQALMTKLYEQGYLKEHINNITNLPHEGKAGKVRLFLLQVQEKRFAQGHNPDLQKIIAEAQKLLEEL